MAVALVGADALPEGGEGLQGFVAGLALTDEMAADDGTGPTDSAPAVNIDAMAGFEPMVDPIKYGLHVLWVTGDAHVPDGHPLVVHLQVAGSGPLLQVIGIGDQFTFGGQVSYSFDARF